MTEGRATVALEADSEDPLPAAWILEYDNGAIGMLYTREPFRGRGYGRIVAQTLTSELAAAHGNGTRAVPPFCYVAEDNAASLRIFEGMGFARRGLVVYLRFFPADPGLL